MATIFVNSTAGLTSALKTAQGGDTIKLAPGTYSDLALKNLSFSSDVTITSADPSKQAVITNFSMTNVDSLTFSNLEMSAINATGVNKNSGWAFRVTDSDDIHFDKINFHGSLDGETINDMNGLQIRFGEDISVTNSTFQQLGRGLAISESQHIKVSGNEVQEVRTDGFNFAQVGHIQVTDNYLHDFAPAPGDHPDAIQFWTTGTTSASHDILVSGNVIVRGEGENTQGIFITDQVGTLPYEQVTIANNLVVGTGYNAIRMVGGKNITVTGNELVTLEGGNKTSMLFQRVDGLLSTNNKAISIGYDGVTNLNQSSNLINTVVKDAQALIDSWGPDGGGDVVLPAANVGGKTLGQVMNGNSANNLLEGGAGGDTINGGGGSDTLAGGAGDDTYMVPNSLVKLIEKSDEGIDTVVARGDHTLGDNIENLVIDLANNWKGHGNALDNSIMGNAGNNILTGQGGNDTVSGGLGSDTITGGAGDDRLIGGDGADRFIFAQGAGDDVIVDFGAGSAADMLDISAFIQAGLTPTLSTVNGNAVISFTNGDSITLLGVSTTELGAVSKVGWIF